MKKIYVRITDRVKNLFPMLLFFWMTYVIFAPSTLFLNNIDEFKMHYIYLMPTFIVMSVIVLLPISLLGIVLPQRFIDIYYVFIFYVTICLYVQMNFLNPPFRTLDGVAINWDAYSFWGYISAGIWMLILLIMILFYIIKREGMKKIVMYIAYFFSLVQLISLIFMIIMAETKEDNYGRFAFAKEDQFTVGEEGNIVVFVLDSLQVEAMEKYCANYANSLADFTFFTNTVSGGAPTLGAMPVLLTGIEYDPMQSRNIYYNEIWEQTQIYDDLEKAGYDIRLFTCDDSTFGMPEGYINGYEKISTAVVSNHRQFISNMYKLVNFLTFPQPLKKYFCVNTGDITDNIGTFTTKKQPLEQYYDFDDVAFYEELMESELDIKYDKAFRLYHLSGAHPPFKVNEKMEKVSESESSEAQQIAGVMKIINLYIEKLKREGLYDKSTIIVVGDHGQHEEGNLMINPAILVKRAEEHHDLEYNDAPVCFRNVVATIIQEADIDYLPYGPTLYDIKGDNDIERLHTIPQTMINEDYFERDDCWKEKDWYRLGVDEVGNVYTWNPYDQNKIYYQLGDVISFSDQNKDTMNLNYRIYREDDIAVFSNEVAICFEVEDVEMTDILLQLKIARVYNDIQKMKVYVNGNYITDEIITSEQIGKNVSLRIPKEVISDTMVIRCVFPGAVTPNMLDETNQDGRVLSIGVETMQLQKEKEK